MNTTKEPALKYDHPQDVIHKPMAQWEPRPRAKPSGGDPQFVQASLTGWLRSGWRNA